MTERDPANEAKSASAGRPAHRWVKTRHRVVFALLKPPLRLYVRLALGFHAVRYRAEERGRPCLILANHDGPFDPIMLSMSFRRVIYFVASDHIFRLGLVSRLISWLVAPIPIVKSIVDTRSIRDIFTAIREGGTVGLFPSGNRSFTGAEMPISRATVKLVRHLKVPVLLYRFDRGYLATPRWARHTRRGRVVGEVVRTLSPDELSAMTNEEVHQVLTDALRDVPPEPRTPRVPFRGRRPAEYLERVLFVCPQCLRMNTMRSRDDLLSCDCGYAVRSFTDGRLQPAAAGRAGSAGLPSLPDVDAFDRFQRAHLAGLLRDRAGHDRWLRRPFFEDKDQLLVRVEREHTAKKTNRSTMRLYSDRLEFESEAGTRVFPLDRIGEVSVHGPQTLQFHDREEDAVYEVRSPFPRSAYRYMLVVEALRAAAPDNS